MSRGKILVKVGPFLVRLRVEVRGSVPVGGKEVPRKSTEVIHPKSFGELLYVTLLVVLSSI